MNKTENTIKIINKTKTVICLLEYYIIYYFKMYCPLLFGSTI